MAKSIGSETIRVIRTPKVDRLSDEESTPTDHEIDGCAILPRLEGEQGKGWVIVEGKMVIAPFGADIEADDEVEIPDEDGSYQVDGKPGPYKNKRGKGKAVIFYLKRLGT